MNGCCCSRLVVRWCSFLALLTPLGAIAYLVGPPSGLDQMSTNATFVCKARVVATTVITNDSFRPIPGFEARAAALEVISVLKGDPLTFFAIFDYYSRMPAGAWSYEPQHYTLEEGQSYLIFGTDTAAPGIFRQIRQSHTAKADEGVTRTLDARRLNGLPIKEAHWLEL